MIAMCLAIVLLGGKVNADRLRELAETPKIDLLFMAGFGASGFADPHADASASVSTRLGEIDARKAARADELLEAVRSANHQHDRVHADERRAELTALLKGVLGDHPDDVKLLVDVSRVLARRHAEEADQLLQHAREIAPNDPAVLGGTAELLVARVWNDLQKSAGDERDDDQLSLYFRNNPPSLEMKSRVHDLLGQAKEQCRRSLAADPERGPSYVTRASTHWQCKVIDDILNGNQILPTSPFDRENVADVLRAADLMPNDQDAQRTAAFAVLATRVIDQSPATETDGLKVMADTAKDIEIYLGRLGTIAKSGDPRSATRALCSAAGLRFFTQRRQEAESLAREALKRDPQCVEAGDLLLALFKMGSRYGEAITLLQDRLEHQDSIRTRLLLANAYIAIDQNAKAEAQVREALVRWPDDASAHLALAALLLKRPDCDHAEVRAHLESARTHLTDRERQLHVDQAILDAIEHGLGGDPAGAARVLDSLFESTTGWTKVESSPVVKRVKEVRLALGQEE